MTTQSTTKSRPTGPQPYRGSRRKGGGLHRGRRVLQVSLPVDLSERLRSAWFDNRDAYTAQHQDLTHESSLTQSGTFEGLVLAALPYLDTWLADVANSPRYSRATGWNRERVNLSVVVTTDLVARLDQVVEDQQAAWLAKRPAPNGERQGLVRAQVILTALDWSLTRLPAEDWLRLAPNDQRLEAPSADDRRVR